MKAEIEKQEREDAEARFEEVFGKKMSVHARDGFARIWRRARLGCVEAVEHQAAYILATAYWESAMSFMPVREGLCADDAAARDYVAKLFADGRIKTDYSRPSANGCAFYGRGYVQLTWEKNYRAIGDHLIGDEALFYDNPDLVMQPELAAIILVRGMVDGIFTGHKLGDFINRDGVDFVNARQTVNRMDRAEKIADWAEKFYYITTGKMIV